MTGDTTPISDEAITRLIKAFYEAHGVESWESIAEYRYGAEHHWMREAFAEIAPLLASAEAERLREQRDNADMSANALAAEVEGLRGELAERDAKLAQVRHALALDVRSSVRVAAALEALRAAGGQEKPNPPAADNWHNWDCNRTNCPGCYDGPRP